MQLKVAAEAFAELGHPVRLAIIRELVKAGAEGINTGEIGKKLAVPRSTLTHHIRKLEVTGLITRKQVAQCLVCYSNIESIRALSQYLLDACCSTSTIKIC